MDKLQAYQISFLIPTKDRPNEIRALLKSVQDSFTKPGEIIFVYSGQDISHIGAEFPGLQTRFEKSAVASQVQQRNRGLELIKSDSRYVACFDDDITLEPAALENMLRFVNVAKKDYAAVAFNIVNTRGFKFNFFKFLFCMSGRQPGRVLRSGYNSNLCNVPGDLEVEWVFGGATLWKKEVICAKTREDHYGSYAFIEDVEFSYGISRTQPLAICASARVHDLKAAGNFHKTVAFGKLQVTARVALAKRIPQLSVPWAYWSCIGQTLENFVRFFVNREPHRIKNVWGNILGFFASFTVRI